MTHYTDLTSADVVAKLGETDQQFLTMPSTDLAITRARLRLRLVDLSNHKQEQVYFLTEAVVLLETALVQAELLDEALALSAALGETYLRFYQLTKEQHYLVVTRQVAKPLAHHNHPLILFTLVRSSVLEGHVAMAKHWLSRLMRLPNIHPLQVEDIHTAQDLSAVAHEDWFKQLLKQKLH